MFGGLPFRVGEMSVKDALRKLFRDLGGLRFRVCSLLQ